jgi:hypothetical protein
VEYDYKKNLQKLKERYLNKIKWHEERITTNNKNKYEGYIMALETAIHDIEYMIDEIPMYYDDTNTKKHILII